MSSDKRRRYEAYRLQWMLDHGYYLRDLLENLATVIEEHEKDYGYAPRLDKALKYFERDCSFNGELWVSYAEWLSNEGYDEAAGLDDSDVDNDDAEYAFDCEEDADDEEADDYEEGEDIDESNFWNW